MQVYAVITLFYFNFYFNLLYLILLNIQFLLFYNQAYTKYIIENYPNLTPTPNQNTKDHKDTVPEYSIYAVSYTHLRAHETGRNLVCRLLLEKKKTKKKLFSFT